MKVVQSKILLFTVKIGQPPQAARETRAEGLRSQSDVEFPVASWPDLNLELVEPIGIEVCGIRMYSVYFPGSRLNPNKLRSLRNDITRIALIRAKFLVGGDLNSKYRFWNCVRANAAGKILFDEMRQTLRHIFRLRPTGPPLRQ